jgi:ABC-2 type transport system permease protein
MRATISLIRREFSAYFISPVAYVTLASFLLVTGYLFKLTMDLLTRPGSAGVEYPYQAMFGDERFWLIFLFIPPLITMRLFAEERASGTLEVLMTSPIRDWQVVFGKYVACLLFYLVLWLPTLAFLPVLVNYDWTTHKAGIDPMPALTTYIGAFLAGAMFLAIGLFVSSLVKSQIVAALITLAISLVFVVSAFWRPEVDPSSLTARLYRYLSVPEHFRNDWTRGLIDTRYLMMYCSATVLCLFLTVRSLEARRLG